MKKNIRFILIIATTLMSLAFLNTKLSYAQTQETSMKIVASPAKQDVRIKKGMSSNIAITFYNQSSSTFKGKLELVDFIVISPDGRPYFIYDTQTSNKYSARSWTDLSQHNITIPAESSTEIKLAIAPPQNASEGGHYFALILKSKNIPLGEKSINKTLPQTSQAVASLVSVTIPGNYTETVNIRKIDAPQFLEYGPINLTVQTQNTGNIHTTTRSFINLKNLFGHTIEQKTTKNTRIFPESSRITATTLGSTYMLGRYKVSVNVFYGNNKSVQGFVYIWIVPWKLVTIILLSLLIIVLLIQKRKRH